MAVSIVRRLDMGIVGGLGVVRGLVYCKCVLKTGCGCDQKAGCEHVRRLGVDVIRRLGVGVASTPDSFSLVSIHPILRHLVSKPVRG